jgi:hypothetical protein
MSEISGNTCDFVTLFPMGVECIPTDAYLPTSTNGSILLKISGGTSPYSIQWSNGQKGNSLQNLSPGTYTAVVSDYYGDYVETISCEVGSETFFLDKFVLCGDVSEIYTPTDPTYRTGFSYTFNNLVGCYEYVGKDTWTGQSYSSLTINTISESCEECQSEPPTPTQPSLCLTNGLDQQYTFTPDGIDGNGNYVWISTGDTLTMSFNIITQRWEIINWTNVGTYQMVQVSTQQIPYGKWINMGNPNDPGTWEVNQGECGSFPLSLRVATTNETCQGQLNGTVLFYPSGGYPPYQYRIQTAAAYPTYQGSPTFIGLPSGNFIGQLIDVSGNTAQANFTISTTPSTTYQLSLVKTPTQIVNTLYSNTKSYNYSISVNPPLPNGVTLQFHVVLTNVKLTTDNGVFDLSNIFEVTQNSFIQPIYSEPTTITTQTGCTLTTQEQYDEKSTLLSMTFGENIYGKVIQTVNILNSTNDCNCKTIGEYTTILSLQNITIQTTGGCHNLNMSYTPITEIAFKESCNG